MTGALSGPGIGLPFPQNLYPSELQNAPQDASSNKMCLAPGQSMVLPRGDWVVGCGGYLVLQFLDPVTGVWTQVTSGNAFDRGEMNIASDGFNLRVANLTGCVVDAVITAQGSGYVQSTTTITAIGTFEGAAPTFTPIVGGALGFTGTFTIDVPKNGAGYGVEPMVMIPPPPPAANNPNGVGGRQAAARAIISGGTISSVTMIDQGAGYPAAPVAVVVPSPFDPNLSSGITQATVSLSLTGAGALTGVLCTNHGSPLNNGSLASVTLSVGGAGATATLSPVVMQTVVNSTISGAGAAGAYGATTYGGVPATGAWVNSASLGLAWQPRPAQMSFPSATVATPATIYDGGLFLGAPTAVVQAPGGIPTIATIALVMGSRPDVLTLQPAP